MSLLDVIDKKIEEFKPSSWSSELAEPMELEHDQFYLGDSHPGTYKHWLLTKQLDVAKAVVEDWHKAREEELKKQEKREEKWEKREDEKREIRESFDDLRKEAIARGAKKFEDLYPDKMPEEHPKNHTATTKERKQWEPKPFKVRVTFQMADLTDAKREQYLELFEAVWAGDIEKVRELTLKADGDREPLQICVQDNRGFAPFHLAIARKHHQLAKLILEIAHAQYRPPQMKKQREQFVLSTGDDEYDDYEHYSEDEGEDGIGISSELVNEEFTIDNIADLTNTVGSKISVSTMISWGAPLWMFSEDDLKIAKKEMGGSWSTHINALHVTDKKKTFHETWSSALGHNSGIYDYAIHKNDISLLKFLLRASNAAADAENPDREKSLGDRSSAYLSQALGLGNMKLAEELILSTGGDIPLGHLARSFGVQEKEKGEFYQGLLLRGKHKSEWARDRDRPVDTSGQLHTPPLLNAARRGDIGSVEWYLSDTPARLYREFLETNSSDKSVVALKKSPKGTEGAVEAWLEATRELAVHAAVLSSGLLSKKQEEADKAIKLIKYLADAVPESLDKKSLTGFTPISLAFSLGSVPAAKALIEAGSNQACKFNLPYKCYCSSEDRAILHSLYPCPSSPSDRYFGRLEILCIGRSTACLFNSIHANSSYSERR